MLEPIRHILSRQVNILASASPRRKEILKSVDFPFEVMAPKFEENLNKETFEHPCEYVKETAKQKAIEVWNRLSQSPGDRSKPDLVIGADTVVTMDGVIYEKPQDKEDAVRILSLLSGQKHTVFTGVALVMKQNATAAAAGGSSTGAAGDGVAGDSNDYVVTTFHEATDVLVTEMSPSVIKAYVATGEPLDKAGAYGIQGIGATLIEGVRGDYFNVMGLPIHRLAKELFHMFVD